MDHYGDQDAGKRPSDAGSQFKYMKSASQLQILKEAYQVDRRPTTSEKENLARRTGLDYFQVQYWFGNQRYYDRHGPRRQRPKDDYNHPAGGESMQVPHEFNPKSISGTPSMTMERVEPSNITEPLPLLVSGSVHNVLNPMPLRSFMPPGAFVAEPGAAQTTPLPSTMTQTYMLPMDRKLQQPVTDAMDEFGRALRADMLKSDTKFNWLIYNAFQASLENMEPKWTLQHRNGEKIEGSCLEPAPISADWFGSDPVMIPFSETDSRFEDVHMLDSEHPSAAYEQHCLPMKPSDNLSVSSTSIFNYGGQTANVYAHVDSASPFQYETSSFIKGSPHGVAKMASSLTECQKGATHDLNAVPKMSNSYNSFYPSYKETHRDCNSFQMKNKQMHRSGSSCTNGFQQRGHERFSFKVAARNANDKHHSWTVQNLSKSHPSRWHRHGKGYDGFIVMRRGRKCLPNLDDSPRPVIVRWNQKEERATETVDDSDNTLSMSSDSEATLDDEHDDTAATQNTKGCAADEETGNAVKVDAKGKSVEGFDHFDAAAEDAEAHTESKPIEGINLDDEDCNTGEGQTIYFM